MLRSLLSLVKDDYKEALKLCSVDDEQKNLTALRYLQEVVDNFRSCNYPTERAEQIFKIFTEKATSQYDDVRALAIGGLGHMIREYLIPSKSIDNLITLCLEKYDDVYETVRCNALWSISNLADKNLIPRARITDVLLTMIDGLSDTHQDTRSNALWCIGTLCFYNLIPVDQCERVIINVSEIADDVYALARVNACGCLGRLAENLMIPESQTGHVLRIMLKSLDDSNDAVRKNAMWCITSLASNNQIDVESVETVLRKMLNIANTCKDESVTKALACLFYVTQFNVIPLTLVDQLLPLLHVLGVDHDDSVRHNAVWIICDLAGSDSIAESAVEDIIILILGRLEDPVDSIRATAFRAISYLVENNVVPPNRIRSIFMVMISHFDDAEDEVRMLAISSIAGLACNSRIPRSKLEQVLLLMLARVDDPHGETASSAIRCVGYLLRSRHFTAALVEEIIVKILPKTNHDEASVRSNSLWCCSILVEYDLISQDWIQDMSQQVARKLHDSDVGVRVTACLCIAFMYKRMKFEKSMISRCVSLLLSVDEDESWKFRALEAVCVFSYYDLGEQQNRIQTLMLNAYQLGTSFYDQTMSRQRQFEISERLEKALKHSNEKIVKEKEKPVELEYAPQRMKSIQNVEPLAEKKSISATLRKNNMKGNISTNLPPYEKWRSMRKSKSWKLSAAASDNTDSPDFSNESSPRSVNGASKNVSNGTRTSNITRKGSMDSNAHRAAGHIHATILAASTKLSGSSTMNDKFVLSSYDGILDSAKSRDAADPSSLVVDSFSDFSFDTSPCGTLSISTYDTENGSGKQISPAVLNTGPFANRIKTNPVRRRSPSREREKQNLTIRRHMTRKFSKVISQDEAPPILDKIANYEKLISKKKSVEEVRTSRVVMFRPLSPRRPPTFTGIINPPWKPSSSNASTSIIDQKSSMREA